VTGRAKMVLHHCCSCAGAYVSDLSKNPEKENAAGLLLLFGLMTSVAVGLVARWGDEGFLAPLHRVTFIRSFDGVDWWDLANHYLPFAVCVAIQVYLLEKMPKWLQFFSAAVVVPSVILGYWFLTGDYNY